MTRVARRHDASPSHAAAGDIRQTGKSAATAQARPAEEEPASASRTAVQEDKADRYSQSQRPAASSQTADAVREEAVSIRSRRTRAADRKSGGEHLSDAAWRKQVQKLITTHGVWGPSTEQLTKIKRADLPVTLRHVYDKMKNENIDGFTPEVFVADVAGRKAYLFQDQFDGFTSYEIRDGAGHQIPLGRDRAFEAEERKRAQEEFEKTRRHSSDPIADKWLKMQQSDEEGTFITPPSSWDLQKPEKSLSSAGLKVYEQMGKPQAWKNPKDGSLLFRDYDGAKDQFKYAVLDPKGKLLDRFTL